MALEGATASAAAGGAVRAADEFPGSAARAMVPDEWGPGQAARQGGGVRWFNPAVTPGTDYIRIDPGDPDSTDPLQQGDHVHVTSGGVQVANHLPLDEWLGWRSWNNQ